MAEPVVGIKLELEKSGVDKGISDTVKNIKTIGVVAKESAKLTRIQAEELKNLREELRNTGKAITANAKMAIAETNKQTQSFRTAAQIRASSSREFIAASKVEQEQLRNARTAFQAGIQIQKQAAQTHKQVAQAQRRQAEEVKKSTRVIDKQAKAWIGLIKKAALWALGARTVFRLIFRVRTEFTKAFRAVFENTEEYKHLTQAVKETSAAFILFLFPAEKTRDTMAALATALETATTWIVAASAVTHAWSVTSTTTTSRLIDMSRAVLTAAVSAETAHDAFNRFQAARRGEEGEALFTSATIERIREITKNIEDVTTEAKDYGSTIKSLIGIQRQFNDFLGQQADRLREAQAEFASATSTARATFMGDIFKIDTEFNKRVGEINQDALDDRQKAFADFHKRVAKAQKRANRDLERERQRHQLEMAFAQRRFLLTGIQNERLFLFERGRLVAQGDVLAVEELDARNELQKQAAQENFDLQMELSEAQFRLQQRIQRETNRELVADLRDALGEQLKAIEEERKEELQEARDAATEQRTEAAQAAGERFADAALALKAEEKQLEESFARKIDDAAQWAVDFAREHELGVEGAVAVAETAFGRNATMERIIRETWDITEQRTQTWSNFMVQRLKAVEQQARATATALGAIAESANFSIQGITGGSSSSLPPSHPVCRQNPSHPQCTRIFRQFGGEDIVSRPTAFMAGEGGAPERVTVEPLSSIGGSFSLGWRGGAIPINVTGGTEGADMAPIGQEIAQGLIIELQNQLAGFRGTRGR